MYASTLQSQQIALVRDLLCSKERNGELDERDKQRLEFINSDYQLSTNFDSPKRYGISSLCNYSTQKGQFAMPCLNCSMFHPILITQFITVIRNLEAIEESVSLLSDADISYDKTEEDLEITYLRSGRRWKRSHYGEENQGDNTTQQPETVDHLRRQDAENQSPDRKKKRSSVSEAQTDSTL